MSGLVLVDGRYVDPQSVTWTVSSAQFHRVDPHRSCAVNLLNQQQCWAQASGTGVGAAQNPVVGRKMVSVAVENDTEVASGVRAPTFQCAIMKVVANGYTEVYCAGSQPSPVLGPDAPQGSGAVVSMNSWYRVRMPQNRPVVQLVTGRGHACARTDENQVYCWGWNQYGQLGAVLPGGGTSTNRPVVVMNGSVPQLALDVAASGQLTCTVQRGGTFHPGYDMPDADGAVRCFGSVRAWNGGAYRFIAGEFGVHGLAVVPGTAGWALTGGGRSATWEAPSDAGYGAGLVASDVEMTEDAGCAIRQRDGRVFCWRIWDGGHPIQSSTGVLQMNAKELLPIDGSLTPLVAQSLTVANGLACAVNPSNLLYCWGGQGAAFGVAGSKISALLPISRLYFSKYVPYFVNRQPTLATGVSIVGLSSKGIDDSFATASPGSSASGFSMCAATSDSRVFCYGYGADGVAQPSITGMANEISLTRSALYVPEPIFSAPRVLPPGL